MAGSASLLKTDFSPLEVSWKYESSQFGTLIVAMLRFLKTGAIILLGVFIAYQITQASFDLQIEILF